MVKLFRKKIERRCEYCARGTLLEDNTILCTKKGIRSMNEKCRKFTYDPTKRIPTKPKALDFEKYKQYDYSL